MLFDLDKALGVHALALKLHAERATRLSQNLANADTPGYKATDIDFRQALQKAQQINSNPTVLKTTHPGHMSLPDSTALDQDVQYRVPMQPSLDGNTVEEQVEKANFTENAIQYEASLRFLDGRIKSLISAIKGE